MAVYKSYSGLSGESIWDAAVKLYKDTPLGIAELLFHNPELELDAPIYGEELIYIPGVIRKKPIFVLEVAPKPFTYTTRTLQTVYDLAVQLQGDLSKLGDFVALFPDLNEILPQGSVITLEKSTDPMAKYFADRGFIPATGLSQDELSELDGVYDYTYDLTYE